MCRRTIAWQTAQDHEPPDPCMPPDPFHVRCRRCLGWYHLPQYGSQLAAPASEVVEIISGWFTAQGHSVRRDFPRPGIVHLTAWNSEDEWDITVRPQSALASVATVIHQGDINAIQACRRLQEYLDGYLLGTAPSPQTRAHPHRQAVPTVVLDRIETVVCIRTRSRGRDVQFSGFVIDPGAWYCAPPTI